MMDKKGQMQVVSGYIIAFVSLITGLVIFFIASPFLKSFINTTKEGVGSITGFLITLIPFMVLFLLIIFFITLRGSSQQ